MLTSSNKIYRGIQGHLFLACLVAPLLLAACGYRGPLYLPDESQTEPTPAMTEPDTTGNLPAEEAGDEDEEDPQS